MRSRPKPLRGRQNLPVRIRRPLGCSRQLPKRLHGKRLQHLPPKHQRMPGRPERTHLRTRRQLATHNALPQRLPRPKLRRVSRRRPTLHSQSARSLQPERQLARTRTVPGRLHGKPLQRLPPEHSRMSEPTGSHAHPHLQTRRHLETHRRLPSQRPLRRRQGQHLPLQPGLPPCRPGRQPRRGRLRTALTSRDHKRTRITGRRGGGKSGKS